MGDTDRREACGRCSFTTVVDAVEERDGSDDADARYDPYAGGHIEVDERDLRLVSAPAILAGRVRDWLDATAERFAYGR